MDMNEITYLAADIMTSPVVTIGPDVTVGEAASLMLKRGFGGIPVVGESGEYLGIVTENWFMPREEGYPLMRGTTFSLLGQWMGDTKNIEEAMEQSRGVRVGDVLRPGHPVADARTPVSDIASTMIKQQVHHMPVLQDGQVVGMVSRHDFLKIFGSSLNA